MRNAWGVAHWPSYISRLDLEQACMARSACHRVAEGSAQVHRQCTARWCAVAPPAACICLSTLKRQYLLSTGRLVRRHFSYTFRAAQRPAAGPTSQLNHFVLWRVCSMLG